jgi:putative ABC transport system permease protein
MFESLRSTLARLREMLDRRRLRDELDDELRLHLELEIEHNISRGMSPDEARRAATMAFGGVQRYREATREARGFITIDRIAADVRFTVRRLRRSPVFAVGVIATLGIGLGAATGIGALVYGVMFRPLPYADPGELVRISVSTPGMGTTTTDNSSGTFVYFQERARSFSALGGYLENEGVVITDGETAERVTGAIVTTNVLQLLGTKPVLGRLFQQSDARGELVPVLISHDVWQRRFGGDSSVVGKQIELNRTRRTILGVLPEGFDFPSRNAAIYYPEHVEATRLDLSNRYLTVVGRLRAGVTIAAAQSEVEALTTHLPDRFPEVSAESLRQWGFHADVQSMRDAIVQPVRAELILLGIMVVVVLLIATTNVATLFLLRAERLRGEVAVSRALGASQAALRQRFIVEGVVVSLAGAITAFPVIALAVSTKFGFTPGQVPRLHDVHLGVGVGASLIALSIVIGVLLGFIAVARAGGGLVAQTLRGETRGTGSRSWRRTQQGLVAVQMALALALLLGAGLVGESLARLRRVDLGFKPNGLVTFESKLPFRPYPTFQRTTAFQLQVMENVRAIPGVKDVAGAMQMPQTPQLLSVQPRIATDRPGVGRVEATATANVVTPNFFSVMGIPLRAGRSFASGDLINPTPGVVISASLARELFGNTDPVGREVRMAASKRYPPYRVVGVVGDVYGDRIADGVLRVLYFPLLQDIAPTSLDTARIPFMPAGLHYVVRTEQPLSALTGAFRRAVTSIDPRVPLWRVTTVDRIVDEATARVRVTMLLLMVASVATLLLGSIGLYSVIAYAVAGRTPEFAVRLALGATSPGIMALVFREGVVVASVGVAAGVLFSLAGAQFIRGVLFEVSATNPLAYLIAVTLLLLTAVIAMYVPARRAGETNPAGVLR